MLYFINNSNNPYYNQAFEEYVFNTYLEGEILILWQNKPCLVLGCYQNVFAEIDVNRARADSVAVIRRISGGGTVYHDLGNLNYTLIKNYTESGCTYDDFIAIACKALNNIGVNAEKGRICDISVDGYKVSGSAQKVAKGRILHHGTLLFDSDLNNLRLYSKGHNDLFESKGIKSSPWQVANIKDYIDNSKCKNDFSSFKEAMLCGMCGGDCTCVSLGKAETEEVERLAKEKYMSWDWTFGANPQFSFSKEMNIDGEPFSITVKSKHGRIDGLSCNSRIDLSPLIGAPLCADIDFNDEIINKLYREML